ncbi:MAG: glycosyltransferase [Anaerolineae bacterium]|nr:glycosyltransferase [Anaerolineae bacterium]
MEGLGSYRLDKLEAERSFRVTAIVSTYNSEEFIEECLTDLENQTIAGDVEIIVIDAASPQNERAIVEGFQKRYSNIRYIRTPQRIGVYAAWNIAICEARGKYLTTFSTNDRLRPDAYELLAHELDVHPEVALVYGDTYLTCIPHETFEHHTLSGVYQWPDYHFEDLLEMSMVGPHPMWRASVHEVIGLFDESFEAIGDQEFWLRMGLHYELRHVPQFTGLYLEHADRLSGKLDRVYAERARIVRKYQRLFNERLQRVVHLSRSGSALDRPRALMMAGLGFVPRSPAGRAALAEMYQVDEQSNLEGECLISAIVSTYNSAQYLQACLEDLERQTISDKLEIIVIDSGSQQNEAEIVRDFQSRYKNIVYLRTQRETLYQAWNRGVKMARGLYITTANTDDAHRADALEMMTAALETYPQADLAYCDYVWVSQPNAVADSSVIRRVIHPPYQPSHALFYCILGCHPVWRRRVFDKLGLFDTSYQVLGDYEFYLRFVRAGLQPVRVPFVLSFFHHGQQTLTESNPNTQSEARRLLSSYRREMPIEKLYQLDVRDNKQKANAWVSLGNVAALCPVPWIDEPVSDLGFALTCYQNALELDPDNQMALRNQIAVLAVEREWNGVDLLLSLFSQQEREELLGLLERSQLPLLNIPLPHALGDLAYYPQPVTCDSNVSGKEAVKQIDVKGSRWSVDVVIPVYGQGNLLQKCVDSALHTTSDDVHLILVDDCSPDEATRNVLQTYAGHPRVALLRTSMNLGFVGACKLGASYGEAPFILFLNSDIEAVENGWLDAMLPTAKDIAVVGAKLLYPLSFNRLLAGKIQHAGVARCSRKVYHPFVGYPADVAAVNVMRDVNAVTGACLLTRRSVWNELGGWDERFGKGVYEDVDFCWRVRQRGDRVVYQPAAVLFHYQSASTSTGQHPLYVTQDKNLRYLLEKWQGISSDEDIFFGPEVKQRWQAAREQIARAHALLDRKGALDRAVEAFEKACVIAPDLPEALIACAKMYATVGNYSQAAAFYEKALAVDPGNLLLRARLVEQWLLIGRYSEAQLELQNLTELLPDLFIVRHLRFMLEKQRERSFHEQRGVHG